jgi:hypothetical protein
MNDVGAKVLKPPPLLYYDSVTQRARGDTPLAQVHSPLKATEESSSMPRPARMEAYFSCNRRYAASGLAPKVSLYAW